MSGHYCPCGSPVYGSVYCPECIASSLADDLRTARTEGRRAGLEEAARIAETFTALPHPTGKQIAEAIRQVVTR